MMGATVTPPGGMGFRIGLVDDDRTARNFLADMLSQCGYTVDQYDGPASFLTACKGMFDSLRPDLILLDVEMPLMNGFELCRILKKMVGLGDIPVLFLSGLSNPRDKVEAFESGGVDYITKPYNLEEVQARISVHLQITSLQKELKDQNAGLEEKVREQVREISESQIATIHALASLVESRDDDTGQHIERTRFLCRFLADRLLECSDFHEPVDPGFSYHLEVAAPLHDIGKVAISDTILLKPGRLTPEEIVTMRTHTTIGSETLKHVLLQYPNNSFISMGIDIARSHHERWDGKGYPDGLAGKAIPLSARIMTIVDVYDALRSDRCYKEAMPFEESLSLILQGEGTQFDPQLVRLFKAHAGPLEALRARFDLTLDSASTGS